MATGNSRPETGKFPPPSTKIPVPKILQNKQTFRSVNSYCFTGFSRIAFCRTSNGHFFYNRTNRINKQKAVYSFITNMSGMHKRWTSVRRTVHGINTELRKSFFCSLKNAYQCLHAVEWRTCTDSSDSVTLLKQTSLCVTYFVTSLYVWPTK